jgi:Fe-S cluster assembly protein SufD
MAQGFDLKEKVIKEFKDFENSLNGLAIGNDGKPGKIHSIRLEALKLFEEIGFPEFKSEEWKYTNIKPITQKDFNQFPEKVSEIKEDVINKYLIPGLDANILVFINGKFSENYSKIITKDKNVFIGSFREGLAKHKNIIEEHFSKYAKYKSDGFTALNTAYSIDGAFIYIPDKLEIKAPVHLVFISDADNSDTLSQPRNLIVTGESSTLDIIESYFSSGSNFSFTNSVTEIYAGSNSRINHYKIQDENEQSYNVSTTQVSQQKDSKYNSLTITWGGSIVRNNHNSEFKGKNGECHFFGLFLAKDKELIDNHTLVDHAVPQCFSNEFYKGILDDNSSGVFNGKIMVRKDAQKTNAYQSNKNIVLSRKATINSKPQLEIFADDVKCSHGATTGQLNPEEVFYLMSRGIGRKESEEMLLIAFANDILENIKIEPLKEVLFNSLINKLKKA